MRLFRLLLFIMLGLSSLSLKSQTVNDPLEEAKKAIARSNGIQFSLFAKNDGSILTLYAEDACLLPPNGKMLCGREEIFKFFKTAYAAGARSGKITTHNIYGDGKEYVTEVNSAQVFDGNGKLVDDSKSVIIWKKTKDGWKMFRDIFNSNLTQH